MKRGLMTLFLLASMVACFSCAPISGEEGENPKTEIDETLKPFVGYWSTRDGYQYQEWLFKPDKSCVLYIDNVRKGEGEWIYNPTTGILATTVDDYQWQVTITAERSWAAISLDEDKSAQSFTRLADDAIARYELAGTWLDSDGYTITFSTYQKLYSYDWGNYYSLVNNWKECYLYWSIVGNPDDYDNICRNICYRLYVDGQKSQLGDVEEMTIYLTDGYKMDKFVRHGTSREVTYTRVESEAQE